MFGERTIACTHPLLAKQIGDVDAELDRNLPRRQQGATLPDGAVVQRVLSWTRRRYGIPEAMTSRVIAVADVRVQTLTLDAGTIATLESLRSTPEGDLKGSCMRTAHVRVPGFGATCPVHGTSARDARRARVRLVRFDADRNEWLAEAGLPGLGFSCCYA